MQSAPATLRIAQAVATILGAEDSLQAINTTEFPNGAVVVVNRSNDDSGLPVPALYILRKTSTTAANPPLVVAPAQGGDGRWFPYAAGAVASAPAALAVSHAAIPPQSSVDAAVTIAGLVDTSDIVVINLADNTVPAGVIMGQVRVTAANSAVIRFLNATAATVAAATVAVEYSIIT